MACVSALCMRSARALHPLCTRPQAAGVPMLVLCATAKDSFRKLATCAWDAPGGGGQRRCTAAAERELLCEHSAPSVASAPSAPCVRTHCSRCTLCSLCAPCTPLPSAPSVPSAPSAPSAPLPPLPALRLPRHLTPHVPLMPCAPSAPCASSAPSPWCPLQVGDAAGRPRDHSDSDRTFSQAIGHWPQPG